MIETDWPDLMPDVARRLLGDPTKKMAREWRYGQKGSLVVHIEGEHPGTWHDFESDTGGGVLGLVQREQRCDQAAALAWLTGEGLLDGAAPRPLQNRHAAPATARRTPGPVNSDQQAARRALATRLWTAAVPAADTPARAYLAGRSVWPPDGIGPSLPASVRWLPRGAVGRNVAADWYDVPEHAAGAIVYAFRQPGGATIRAVGLDALDGGGRQPGKRWRRTFGQKKGAAFVVGAVGGDPLVLVEGEVDALASVWLHPGSEVWAAGGGGATALAPAILTGRRVVIEADPDGPGRDAALKLDKALGGRAEISWNQGGDPADVWTATLGERAAIMEFDGGLPRNESEQRAWALAIERR